MARTHSDTDDGDQELAESHTESTANEKSPAADAVDEEDTGDGHGDVDDVRDDGDHERVGDTGLFELKSASFTVYTHESSSVVKDKVDTGELLPDLDNDTSHGTLPHALVAADKQVLV